uniref:Uncharacterized protein LOC102806317 n=1 Tax=Saccoglossus kowalevskii TaxID=10224 RepID=A0ABM0N112_SACKO|nr:PREDICTED: uncharacterized protein LOC102806317 [Saccoglossus kowalevskii]
METDDILVGVCMTSESYSCNDGRSDTMLGFTVINPFTTTLAYLRCQMIQQLEALPTDYKFLTCRGWPVSVNQETALFVSQVIDKDAIIEVSNPSLQDSNFIFLDRNLWPVGRDQERFLTVLDILNGVVVQVRIITDASAESDDTLIISDVTESTSPPAAKKFKRSSPVYGHSSVSPLKMVTFKENNVGKDGMSTPKSAQIAKQMLISYVRQEAAHHALALKTALEKLGFSVYLDVHEITCGADWQDSLNYAVSNCEVFVPLVTPRYGETQWTNREVKLADVLGKLIVPVSFLSKWPPPCLAIQFATTQYVRWKTRDEIRQAVERGDGDKASDIKYWESSYIERVAKAIGDYCKSEFKKLKFYGATKGLSRKVSMLKSYAASLPESANDLAAITQDREGKPLVVVSLHPDQKDYAFKIRILLEADGHEVWCSTDMFDANTTLKYRLDALPRSASDDYSGPSLSGLSQSSNEDTTESSQRSMFQEKADEAGVVVFVLSKSFAESQTCQQQVFYCEHRKRVVPLKYEDFAMPGWMSMLIGTSTFEDFRRDGYAESLRARVKKALDPKLRDSYDDELKETKINVHINCIKRSLPKDGNFVYISGGTKFFWDKSEAICKAIGKSLAEDDCNVLVTGGFYGVGETVARSFLERRISLGKEENVWHILPTKDDQDRRLQGRQNENRTFQTIPFGQTLFSGESVRQRESVVARVFDICILVEGGPGAAHEAEEFAWNDHTVIPIKCTGGAAGGKFNVPSKIFEVPSGVKIEDWQLLGNQGVSPAEIGEAAARVVNQIQNCPAKRMLNCNPESRMLKSRMTIIPPQPPSPTFSKAKKRVFNE